jgi:hypothetical protein
MQPALRSPPAFEVSVGGDSVWRALCACLYGLTAAALMAWASSHQPVLGSLVLGASLLVIVLSAWLGWRLAAQPACRLRWDGQTWQLVEPGREGKTNAFDVRPAIELDSWLMLRLTTVDGNPLMWRHLGRRLLRFERHAAEPHWLLLRATLHTARIRQPAPAMGGTQP